MRLTRGLDWTVSLRRPTASVPEQYVVLQPDGLPKDSSHPCSLQDSKPRSTTCSSCSNHNVDVYHQYADENHTNASLGTDASQEQSAMRYRYLNQAPVKLFKRVA